MVYFQLKKLDRDEVAGSAISTWETMAALCFTYKFTSLDARAAVNEAIAHFGFTYVPITATEANLAASYEHYGLKEQSHIKRISIIRASLQKRKIQFKIEIMLISRRHKLLMTRSER